MIEILPESSGNILAVKGAGRLSREDYENVLLPRLQSLVEEHPEARFLFYMEDDFKGWDLAAAWHYARFGLKHKDRFEKVAAVCGPKWVHFGMKLKSYFVNGDVRSFPCEGGMAAREWIEA